LFHRNCVCLYFFGRRQGKKNAQYEWIISADDDYVLNIISGKCGDVAVVVVVAVLLVLPGGVLEGVFVVEGHEEPEDGQEHDGVAGDHQKSSSPVNLKLKRKTITNLLILGFIFLRLNNNSRSSLYVLVFNIIFKIILS